MIFKLFVLWNFMAIMLSLLCAAFLFVLYAVMISYEIHSWIALIVVFSFGGFFILCAYLAARKCMKAGSPKALAVVQEFIQGFMQK